VAKVILGLIVSLIVFSVVDARIYKWKDASGQVHFGSECPHESCDSIESIPFKRNKPIPLPEETRTQSSPASLPAPQVSTDKKPQSASNPIIKSGQCLDSVTTTLGKGSIDPYEPIESVKPGAEQYRLIRRFLTQLPRFLHGTMVEETCKGSLKNPVSEHVTYQINMEIIHDLKGNFDFKSVERGENNIARQTDLKILITKDNFHAGESRSQISSKRWAVALLKATASELVFLQQFRTRGPQGGNLQRMILRSYRYSQKKLYITEYEYTQDQLVLIRKTTVK